MIGISLHDFWGDPDDIYTGMTLAEYDLQMQGFQAKQDLEWQRAAFISANIMNLFVKKGEHISPQDLLSEKKDQSHDEAMLTVREAARLRAEKQQAEMFEELGVGTEDEDAVSQEPDFAQHVMKMMQQE